MKRIYLRTFSVLFGLLAVFLFTARTAEASQVQDTDGVESAVTDYLTRLATEQYLYEDADLEVGTVSTLSADSINEIAAESIAFTSSEEICAIEESVSDSIQLSYTTDSMSTYYTEFSSYMRDKCEYLKYMRLAQNIERENFAIDFSFEEISYFENFARVKVVEQISFQYTDCDDPSYCETTDIVDLYELDGNWYILGISSSDSFDTSFDLADFDLEGELAAIDSLYGDENSGNSEPVSFYIDDTESNSSSLEDSSVTPLASTDIPVIWAYNRANAARYAYTYTTSTSNDPTNYYNKLFTSYDADCQNFASQCVWAGLGGSNDSSSVNNALIPMTTEWHGNPTKYWPWTGCTYFYSYISETTSGTRITADCYTFSASTTNYSSIDNYSTMLIGSVVQGYGKKGDYHHSMVVNNVTSAERSGIYYCAHTDNAKNMKLGDRTAEAVKIIIPRTFYYVTTCSASAHNYSTISDSSNGQDATCNSCDYVRLRVRNTLQNPVAKGTTVALSGTTSLRCYRMSMSVTAPDGTVSWLGEVYNTASMTANYTFSSTGLYTITTYARDLNPTYSNSIACSNTYTIRVY